MLGRSGAGNQFCGCAVMITGKTRCQLRPGLSIASMPSPSCPHEGCICQPLLSAKRGERVVVRHLPGDTAQALRLRELGFMEKAEISVVCSGGAIIAEVQGARVCLSQHMARHILVAAV